MCVVVVADPVQDTLQTVTLAYPQQLCYCVGVVVSGAYLQSALLRVAVIALFVFLGMMELLDELRKDNYEVIIISDANSEFIRCILQAAGVFDIVHTTYTNPAHWDASGRLHVQYYHTQDWCDLSTRNLCKGQILDTHIKVAQEQRSVKFSHVVYVGDGRNDLCPSLRLKSGDVICPRKGFSLVKDLAKLQEGELKCKVVPWDTGFVLLRHIKELSCS